MFKILLVEDDVSFRQLLCGLIESQFATVQVSESKTSVDALFQLQDSRPDLIMININLFDGGLTLCRKVKALYPQSAVVMTANQDIPECRQAAFRAGANCLISKSDAFIDEVLALVEGCLTIRSSAATSAARATDIAA